MKRTATLVAGLLLVTGTVFAAESKLDFSGSQIQAKTSLVNTQGEDVNADSDDNTTLILQAKYDFGNNTTATFKFDTDSDDDHYDDNLNIKLKTVQGKVEAQLDAGLSFNADETESSSGNQLTASGIQLREELDSEDTYIKYNHTKDMAVTFFPYNMNLTNGSMFDEDDYHSEVPGVVLSYKNAYVGMGMDYVTAKEAVTAVKAGFTAKTAKATLTAKYSGAFWDEDAVVGTTLKDFDDGFMSNNTTKLGEYAQNSVVAHGGNLGAITGDFNLNLNYKLSDKITLDAEAGMVTLNDDYALYSVEDNNKKDIDSGYGITAKATYALSKLATPYVQVKYTTDGYLAYGDMDDFTLAEADNNLVDYVGYQTGGLTEVIAGADYKLTDKLTLNGEAKLQSAGEKVFKDANGEKAYKDEGKDSAFKVSVGATFKF